ncbi:MAG: NAD(+) synthase [Armatimonadota bacterium]|nr:NAD(+) synthase [Armatimonadota bacterium]
MEEAMEEFSRRLVVWLQDQANAAGAVGAVVGISGGVDSATVAALCLRAFPEHTLGVVMPCHSDPIDIEDAYFVARTLGLPVTTVTLDLVYDGLLEALRASGYYADHPIALANLKPRLRMATLYFFANRLNRLVVGTGNRSEIYVGYFTKYGDGGVDVLPLGNLTKRQVRELARYLGVPERIIEKTPSAGLWPGQTDEGELGITYEQLDGYLLGEQVPPEVAARIEALHRASMHKRTLPPVPDFPP